MPLSVHFRPSRLYRLYHHLIIVWGSKPTPVASPSLQTPLCYCPLSHVSNAAIIMKSEISIEYGTVIPRPANAPTTEWLYLFLRSRPPPAATGIITGDPAISAKRHPTLAPLYPTKPHRRSTATPIPNSPHGALTPQLLVARATKSQF